MPSFFAAHLRLAQRQPPAGGASRLVVPARRRALGLVWLLLLLGACGGPAAHQPSATQQLADVPPLPPALHQLLYPLPTDVQADARRLTAALPNWARDSLAQLLLHSRLGNDYEQLQQLDSMLRHLRLAWRLASPALRRRQPAEVVLLASNISGVFDA